MVKISAVILTHNSISFIRGSLDALFKQQIPEVEIILVDNGSSDTTPELLKKEYPQARLIENKSNLGACFARNQAIAVASGDWILTLDCDVVIDNNFLQEALRATTACSLKTGMIQPKIMEINRNNIYSAGIRRSVLSRFYDIGKGSSDTARFNSAASIFGACSAAALYRRKMLEEVKDRHGYFDERFFFLFEDADLSWRAKRKGWGCEYSCGLICAHHGNSSATDKKTRQFLSFRNRRLMILKNQHPVLNLLMLPLYLAYDLPRFIILAVKFGCRFPQFG